MPETPMTWTAHIIDANLNRAREGLRVLEEFARFVLRDTTLYNRIRDMRHQLQVTVPVREVARDPGALSDFASHSKDAPRILNANAARVQEALRVLEEYSDDKALYARLRFETYDIHQALFVAHRRAQLRGFYIIVDPNAYDVSAKQVAERAAQLNSRIVQLRYKNASKREIIDRARVLRQELPCEVMLIINDHIDIALAVADGVHLGQNDFLIDEALRICPPHFIIGATAHNVSEALAAEQAGATYVSMGCVFTTTTKHDTTPIEIDEIVQAKKHLKIPLCVIGGISGDNIEKLASAKPDMIAMCSAIWEAHLCPSSLQ